jgi:hypothetical protein
VLAGCHAQSQYPPPQHAGSGISAVDFERATQQVGEATSPSFLAPHRREDRTVDAGHDIPTNVAAEPHPRAGYEAFLDDIVAVAERFGFERRPPQAVMNHACADGGSDFHLKISPSAAVFGSG